MTEPATRDLGSWRHARAVRTLWWLPLLSCVLAGSVAYQKGNATPQRYTSTSLVVASSLEVSPTLLARFGSTLFDSGAVASSVIATEHLAVTPEDLVPEKLAVQPLQDSILFRVTGTADDAQSAQMLADDGAQAFVVELNKPGKGIGTFAVQQRATAGRLASSRTTTPGVLAAVGAAAGLVAGLGLLLLVLAVTRPVATEDDLADLVLAPFQGRLVLWRGARAERLAAGAAETVAARLQLLAGRNGRLVLHPAGKVDVRAVADALEEAAKPSTLHLSVSDDVPVLGDGPHRPRRVLVVAEGTGRGGVRRALERVPAEPAGVIVVARRSRRRRTPAVATHSALPAARTASQQRTVASAS